MFGIKRRDSNAPPGPTGTLNLSAEDYGLLLGIYEQQLGTRDDIMALTKQVQDLLDRSKQETDLIKSMSTSMKALLQQSADMQSKLDQVPVAPAPAMSQEDKDALNEIAGDMDTAILTAQQAIPQNTPQAPNTQAQGSESSGGSTGIASQAQGGSVGGAGDSTQTGGSTDPGAAPPPASGTATPPAAPPPDQPPQTSQTQADAAQADSQHKQDANAAQQAKPLAGTGGA